MSELQTLILNMLGNLGISGGLLNPLYYIILSIAVIMICAILELFGRWVLLSVYFRITKNSKHPIFAFLKKHHLMQRIIHLVSPFVISLLASSFDTAGPWISHAATIYIMIIVISIVDAALSVIDDVYRTHEVSKKRPIKSFLQIIEIIIVIVFLTVLVASWINESPLVLLSGIGAFTAIISIIFKIHFSGLSPAYSSLQMI